MDIRKLQSTGGSSLSVILPKKWVIAHSLSDKEEVQITENYSGEINITPLKIKEAKKYITVDLDGIEHIAISSTLKSLYKVGYDELTFTYTELDLKSKNKLKSVCNELLGMEIVEENSNRLMIRNLVDYCRMPVSSMQQKAISSTFSMVEDAVTAIKTGDSELAQDVIDRDAEIDKICLYIQRVYYSLITGRVSEREVSLSALKLNYYKEVMIQVERIADSATQLARIIALSGAISATDLEEFNKAESKLLVITKDLFELLNTGNYHDVNQIAVKIANVKKLSILSEEDYQSGTFTEAVLWDSLNRLRGQLKNIIEIVNDYLIIN